jgi:hypothetical protein
MYEISGNIRIVLKVSLKHLQLLFNCFVHTGRLLNTLIPT